MPEYIPGGAVGVVTITAGGKLNNRRLTDLAEHLQGRAERVALVHAELVRYWAMRFAPVQQPNDLGFIQNDRKLRIREGIVLQRLGPTRYAVVATAPQSAPQEFGSQPHDIVARNPPNMLHFYWQREGTWMRTLVVHHPGNAPHPFMLPARRKVAATFYRQLRGMFDESGIDWRVR